MFNEILSRQTPQVPTFYGGAILLLAETNLTTGSQNDVIQVYESFTTLWVITNHGSGVDTLLYVMSTLRLVSKTRQRLVSQTYPMTRMMRKRQINANQLGCDY